MTDDDKLVEVTQADEAAVANFEWFVEGGLSEADKVLLAQAFARHRIEALHARKD